MNLFNTKIVISFFRKPISLKKVETGWLLELYERQFQRSQFYSFIPLSTEYCSKMSELGYIILAPGQYASIDPVDKINYCTVSVSVIFSPKNTHQENALVFDHVVSVEGCTITSSSK